MDENERSKLDRTVQALETGTPTPADIVSDYWTPGATYDAALLYNIALCAERSNNDDALISIAEDFLEHEEFGAVSDLVQRVDKPNSNQARINALHAALSKNKHIGHRFREFEQRTANWGILGFLTRFLYKSAHLPIVMVLAFSDSDHPRLRRLPHQRLTKQK